MTRLLTCPRCSRPIVRRQRGNGWDVLPDHVSPISGERCSGSGLRESGEHPKPDDAFDAWVRRWRTKHRVSPTVKAAEKVFGRRWVNDQLPRVVAACGE